jgi:hypothetical protein
VLSTNPVSPRIGFAWDVIGDHKTVLRAHYGRYYDALLGGTYQFMDLSHQPPTITALVLAEGGCANGLGPNCEEIDRFTPAGNFAIDDNIKHSYVDQYLIGIERELFPAFAVQAQYIKRNFRDFMAFVDTRSVYEPVTVIDPGEDGVLNTGDDGGPLTVFNLTNPGEGFKELTNPDDATRDYDAFQLIAKKRYSQNWQLNASYTWSKSEGLVNNAFFSNAANGSTTESNGQDGVFANPNHKINLAGSKGVFDYTHQWKVEGTYRLPLWGGFNFSGVYRYTTGLAWGRRATIRNQGLAQGSETVRIEPRGTRRTDPLNRLDFRAEKTFELGGSRQAGIVFDIFNLTNQGVIDNEIRTAILDVSASNFGQPNFWIAPRQLRMLLRFSF